MATISQSASFTTLSAAPSWLAGYRHFVENAEFFRFGWAATALMIQGCLLTPAYLFVMYLFGGADWQFFTASLCFLLVLIPILSAAPVKYLFPAFGLSVLIQLSIIVLDILYY